MGDVGSVVDNLYRQFMLATSFSSSAQQKRKRIRNYSRVIFPTT